MASETKTYTDIAHTNTHWQMYRRIKYRSSLLPLFGAIFQRTAFEWSIPRTRTEKIETKAESSGWKMETDMKRSDVQSRGKGNAVQGLAIRGGSGGLQDVYDGWWFIRWWKWITSGLEMNSIYVQQKDLFASYTPSLSHGLLPTRSIFSIAFSIKISHVRFIHLIFFCPNFIWFHCKNCNVRFRVYNYWIFISLMEIMWWIAMEF